MIRFFFSIQRKNRLLRVLLVLSLIPIGISLLFLLARQGLETHEIVFPRLYPQMAFFFYLHLLLPLLSALVGPALFAEEARTGTLCYFWTRPFPPWKAFLSKYIVHWAILSAILCGSLTLVFSLLHLPLGPGLWGETLPDWLRGMAALSLGSAAYLALFFLFGVLFKKAVPMALLFSFGWENLIAYFPSKIRWLTIVHHLHAIFPTFFETKGQGLLGLFQSDSHAIPTWDSALIFLGLIAIFSLATALGLLSRREATNGLQE